MTQSANSKLHSLLFAEGRELVNIKFFPGTDRGLTAARLSDAAEEAIRLALDGDMVSNPPVTGMVKCKLEHFI